VSLSIEKANIKETKKVMLKIFVLTFSGFVEFNITPFNCSKSVISAVFIGRLSHGRLIDSRCVVMFGSSIASDMEDVTNRV